MMMTKRFPSFLIALVAVCCSTQLLANAVVDPTTQPVWGIGGFTLKETNLKLGATKAYRTWFENGAWQGDVVEYDVTSSGSRSTDVTVGDNPASDGLLNNWSARYEFSAQEAAVVDYWKSAAGRKIVTWNGTAQVAFRFDTISASQRTALDPDTTTTGSYDSEILNFVRGDRSQESPAGILRARYSLLGDPGKVQSLYVGAPTVSPLIAGHAQYKADNINRAGRVIVPANDGMIHVFDADTGIEEYAYVPSMLIPTLKKMTTLAATHNFYADGQLTRSDAKIGSTWKTLVAGGLGAGAKGMFALDVSTPTLSSETSTAAADQKILWEKTGDVLGYIHGAPTIAPIDGANWYVISGNGYSSVDGTAKLYMVPVGGGTAITIATNLTSGNGLSAPALIDTDSDGDVDIAYAGDLLGNMWKFDLNNPGTAAQLLFAAGVTKPITITPDVAVHPNGGYLVFFGTGSLLSGADGQDRDTLQSVYAIWDYPGRSATITDTTVVVDTVTHNVLLSQTLSVDQYSHTVTDPDTLVTTTTTRSVRLATDHKPNWSYNRGWKVDLSSSTGERVINDVTVRANRLQFVTDTPIPTTDSDHPTGESWLLELHWLSGGDVNSVFFDLSADGLLNSDDKVLQDDGVTLSVPIGISLGLGNRSKPTFGRIKNGVDTLFINGVDLAVFNCSGSCEGGLEGGHFDVDTDLELGGGTDSHKHEYDDSFNVTFVDYFDVLSGNSVDDIGLDVNEKFVAVLANADFSNKGVLRLKNKEWNVVEYQELIQARLTAYAGFAADPTGATLIDDDGDSLVFTLQEIIDAGADSTMSITFDYNAIITGGLHPSVTGCVKGQSNPEFGRWRNGAFTFQLIKLSTILDGAAAGNSWIAQEPVDLPESMTGGGVHGNPDNDSGFIYESTVFWHWSGDIADEILVEGGGMCYGEDGWYDAKRVETGGLTVEEFSSLFPNYELQADYIDSLASQLENFTCDDGVGIACKKEAGYATISDDLKELVGNVDDFLYFRQFLNGGLGGGGSGIPGEGSDGTVAEEVGGEGDTDEETIFTGTPTGRISWIDLRS